MVQGKGNLQQKTKWIKFDTYSSSIHDEWLVSSLHEVILSSSYALLHLQCEFILGLSQIEFDSFLQGLVQQNN